MSFVHFGCWNNGYCDMSNPHNGLSQTMATLSNYIRRKNVEFIIVAGDNYYPRKVEISQKTNNGATKSKKFKIFSHNNLLSGFECLVSASANKPIHMIYGNHEIGDTFSYYLETTNHNMNSTNINKAVKQTNIECQSIQEVRRVASSYKNIKLFDDVYHIDTNGSRIIMIDSSVYEYANVEMQNEESVDIVCFEHVFTKKRFSNITELLSYQNKKILSLIDSTKHIVLVSHHPLIESKNKEKKEKKKNKAKNNGNSASKKKPKSPIQINPNESYLNVVNQILNKMTADKNLTILCADTHLYQHDTILINGRQITQIIAGTGGAKLDEANPIGHNVEFDISGNHIALTINNSIKQYGFLECNIKDTNPIECVFVPAVGGALLNNAAGIGGGGNKRFSRKRNCRK